MSPRDWQPTELFSELSKDMASSHHFHSTVGSQKQEIKKNNRLYNVLEDKFGHGLLSWRDGRDKGQGYTALLICCGSWTVCLGGPGVFMKVVCVGRSRTSSGVALTPE